MNSVQVAAAEGVALQGATRRRCESFISGVLKRRNLDGWELSVLLCADPRIRELNRRYRGIDRPTDVLAFSQREAGPRGDDGVRTGRIRWSGGGSGARRASAEPFPAGDIVISLECLRRNAAERGIDPSEELRRLLIHGILHLEGMEHPEEGPNRAAAGGAQAAMMDVQEQLLRELKPGRLL